ncbi:ferredoxin--NADP reductase [Castellaniella sp. S9]|uniref:ferredoxin--NADP reductase n=1 Tax=Castellaniella sp. S9 TaxID=2993652 RepID=UPI0022B3E421|nr:FAD-dependent oxidoreductase [Castellaniella sp. S9]
MPTYDTRLIDRATVARDTEAFRFAKPEGFAFVPGQTISLALPQADADAPPLKHTFSLVSAPHEDTLCIATRMRDTPFKQALAALVPGAAARFSGPYGKLTLPETAGRPLVLLAGGIGITPYMSMLRHATHAGTPHRFVLLYSNRRAGDAAFLDELRELTRLNPQVRLLATFTAPDERHEGLHGRIDAAAVRRAADGLSDPWIYITGSPGMIEALGEALAAAGMPEASIRSEGFYGY